MNWEVIVALLLAAGLVTYLLRYLRRTIEQIKDEFDDFK